MRGLVCPAILSERIYAENSCLPLPETQLPVRRPQLKKKLRKKQLDVERLPPEVIAHDSPNQGRRSQRLRSADRTAQRSVPLHRFHTSSSAGAVKDTDEHAGEKFLNMIAFYCQGNQLLPFCFPLSLYASYCSFIAIIKFQKGRL